MLVDPPRAFLETTVVGPTTGEYAQAAVWWVLDGDGPDGVGRVVHEVGWFDWSLRTSDARRSRGSIPPDDRRPRDPGWYTELTAALVGAWNDDALRAARDHLPPAATVTRVGHDEMRAAAALAALATLPPNAVPEVEVVEVLGEGGAVAALCLFTTGSVRKRGTVVLTLGGHDEVTSVRLYLG